MLRDTFGAIRALRRRERPYGRELQSLGFVLIRLGAHATIMMLLTIPVISAAATLSICVVVSVLGAIGMILIHRGRHIWEENLAKGIHELSFPETYRTR